MPRNAFDRVAALERGGQVLLDRGAKRANLSGAQHRLRSSATIHPRVGGSVEKSPQGWEVHRSAGPVRGSCGRSWGQVEAIARIVAGGVVQQLGSSRLELQQAVLWRQWGHLEAPASFGWPTSSRAVGFVFETAAACKGGTSFNAVSPVGTGSKSIVAT